MPGDSVVLLYAKKVTGDSMEEVGCLWINSLEAEPKGGFMYKWFIKEVLLEETGKAIAG